MQDDKRPGLGGAKDLEVWGCGAGLLSVGTLPGISGDEPGEACRDDGEDILNREQRGQSNSNAIGRFGDLGDELDQPVAQGGELATRQGDRFGMRLWNVQSSQ